MPTRDERRAEAAKHLALMKGAFAKETQTTIDAAVVYEDGDALALELPKPTAEATETQVTTDFTTTALRRAQGKTAIVDPVSYTRPGGAYEDGSFGPEQILCSESNLYPILCGMKSVYHDQNRSYMCGMLLTSRAMYLPNVVFIREGKIREANVIAVPEPNRERALENHRSERECLDCLAARIETMLNIAAANEIETLIVNAYACGRQGFQPTQVIELFQQWIAAHPGAIKTIVFAVPRASFDAFDEAFGQPAPVVEEVVAPAEEQEDDEFDFRAIDLPEGITIR